VEGIRDAKVVTDALGARIEREVEDVRVLLVLDDVLQRAGDANEVAGAEVRNDDERE
jgi:hypothetical protein